MLPQQNWLCVTTIQKKVDINFTSTLEIDSFACCVASLVPSKPGSGLGIRLPSIYALKSMLRITNRGVATTEDHTLRPFILMTCHSMIAILLSLGLGKALASCQVMACINNYIIAIATSVSTEVCPCITRQSINIWVANTCLGMGLLSKKGRWAVSQDCFVTPAL